MSGGLPPTGNYRATRADRNSPWSDPVPLPDDYGVGTQTRAQYRHGMHKVPSGNLYLWEWFANVDNLLRFGERTGGSDEAPTYAPPITIPGSTNFETQIWANDAETRLIYNHREADGETQLHTRTRATVDAPWGPATVVDTAGFADEMGRAIWGEPSFDHSESFMMFVRFSSNDYACFTPEIMYSAGTPISGFAPPVVLN